MTASSPHVRGFEQHAATSTGSDIATALQCHASHSPNMCTHTFPTLACAANSFFSLDDGHSREVCRGSVCIYVLI